MVIPNNVTVIGNAAFSECSGLTSVTIGSGVQRIDSSSFSNCPELTDVFCLAEEVPMVRDDAFEDSYAECATLHVPASAVEAYKVNVPWSGFKQIDILH